MALAAVASPAGGTMGATETRDEEKTGGGDDDTTAGDELNRLLPAVKQQFRAIKRQYRLPVRNAEEEDTASKFAAVRSPARRSSFALMDDDDDKENAGPTRRSSPLRFKRREGSGRVTSLRPINFDQLLRARDHRPPACPISSSLHKNITTALKDKVNGPKIQSQIVDDFRMTEKQRKISAEARKKLTGTKTPVGRKPPQVVEDRRIRHARSRRADGTKRGTGRRPTTFDLDSNAVKIFSWDQETLAEEEEEGRRRSFSARATKPAWVSNFCSAARPRNENSAGARTGAAEGFRNGERAVSRKRDASSLQPITTAAQDARSPRSPSSMDMSPADAPNAQQRQDGGFDGLIKSFAWLSPRGNGKAARLSGDGERDRGGTLREGDAPGTPKRVSPDSIRRRRTPQPRKTSPTPPSNPLAAYAARRSLQADAGVRKLAFFSSPSSTPDERRSRTCDSEGSGGETTVQKDARSERRRRMTASQNAAEADNLNAGIEEVCNGDAALDSTSKENCEKVHLDGGECPSRLSNHETHVTETFECDDQGGEIERDGDLEERHPDVPVDKENCFSPADSIHTAVCSDPRSRAQETGPHMDEAEALPTKPVQAGEDGDIADRRRSADNLEEAKCDDFINDGPRNESETRGGPTAREGVHAAEDDGIRHVVPHNHSPVVATAAGDDGIRHDVPDTRSPVVDAAAAGDDNILNVVPDTRSPVAAEADDGIPHVVPDTRSPVAVAAHDEAPSTQGLGCSDEGSTNQARPNKARQRRSKAEKNRRSSLADAGSIWQDGQRRSQRIRVKPVEWWRGEKLLYGRIHKSVVSLIGLKHSVNEREFDDRKFTVESFVPEQYQELVRYAAI